LVQSNSDHSVSEIFINIAKSLVKQYEWLSYKPFRNYYGW
jgi:hypothetical protein